MQKRHEQPDRPHGTNQRYNTGCRCSDCRRAHAIRAQAWRQQSPDKARAARRRWRVSNPGKDRASMRRWRASLAHRPDALQRYQEAAARWRRTYRERHPAAPARTAIPMVWPYAHRADQLDPLTTAINAAVPRSIPAHIREDIAQELALDMLTNGGDITPAAVAAAVRQYWKRYPLMAGRELSLDAPRWTSDGTSRERWIDQLEARS